MGTPPSQRDRHGRRNRRGGKAKNIFAIVALFLVLVWIFPLWQGWKYGAGEPVPNCSVDRVIDGDTADLACVDYGTFRARLTGYDAPELYTPRCEDERVAAMRASDRLAELFAQSAVTEFRVFGQDRYGRMLMDARVDGDRVADIMVAEGHGRRYWGDRRRGWCGPLGRFSVPDPVTVWRKLTNERE